MEAGLQAPDGNGAATKDEPILLSPDTQSDVEMNEPDPAANPAKSASSPSPASLRAPHQSEPPKALPSSASPPQSNGASAPSLGGGHISPVENNERTMQAPVPSTTTARAAPAMPNAATAYYPQATQGPQPSNMNAPTFGTPSQLQHRPSLSQQVPTKPVAYLPSMAATQSHAPAARVAPPAPLLASQGPRVPSHLSRPHQPASMQGNDPHQSPIYPSSRTTASAVSSQHPPSREPHPTSALDPYTMENLFTNGGYHLPDAGDSQLSPQAYVDQCNRLYAVVRTMNPSVVRRVVRDTWQSSLAGSEAHISFVVSQGRFLRCSLLFPANQTPR